MSVQRRGILARLHRLAESGWGSVAVGGWALLQGSVVPGPSDALLLPLGLSEPGRVYRLALWATVGATVGGMVGYLIGVAAFPQLGKPLLDAIGANSEFLMAAFERHGWELVALSAVSPVSTKAMCVAAGAFGVPFWEFLPALLLARALRFLGLATLIRLAGPRVLGWLSRRVGAHRVTPPPSIPG